MIVYVGLFVVGWLAGAGINYLSDILPRSRRLSAPVCIQCGHQRPWWEYLLLSKCATCQKPVGSRTWWVVFFSIVFVIAIWVFPAGRIGFWPGVIWLIYLGAVIVIDVEHHLVLHPVSWFGAGLALLTGSLIHGVSATILGGVTGYGIMWMLYLFGMIFLRWINRRRENPVDEVALGYGDVNLSGVLGLLLGWPGIVAGLVLAIVLSGGFSLIFLLISLLLKRYHAFTAIPFAPFLVAGAGLLLFFGRWLVV